MVDLFAMLLLMRVFVVMMLRVRGARSSIAVGGLMARLWGARFVWRIVCSRSILMLLEVWGGFEKGCFVVNAKVS